MDSSQARRKVLFWTVGIPAVAAIYFVAAKLGLSMALLAEQVSLVWPATGFALAAVLLFGYRVWPGIALGALMANATANEPFATACGIAVGNTLEAVGGAWLLRRAGFDCALGRLSDVVKLLVLAAGISTTISATIGVVSLSLGGVHPWDAFGSLWWTWWIGDAMGNLVVAPLLLTWAADRSALPHRWREAIILTAGLSATCLIVFTERWTVQLPGYPLAFAVFPFAIWAALRFGQRGTAAVILIAAGLAILGAVGGVRLLEGATAHERLLVLQLFLGVIAVTALLLGAAATERKLAWEALQHQTEWLDVILTSVGDAVMVTDANARVTFLNPAAQKLTGWGVDAYGKQAADVFLLIEAASEKPAAVFSDIFHRRGEISARTYQAVLASEDRGGIPIEITSAPILDGGPKGIDGVVVVFRDITERQRDEQRKDEFLATLAHELRNPLAPISNALQLLRLTDDLTPAVTHMREIMERQVNHLVRLVDDLLEISRITRGKIELRKERVDLIAVVGNAVETSRPVIEAAGHQLAIALASAPMMLEADAVRLAQVIANLLNNAAKYTQRGGQIWLTTRREGNEVVIVVRDTGLGISAEMLPRVFEMFAQVDSTRKRAQGGLGIGLTLAKSLVQMHGGRIEAHSEGLGRGSEFVVHLPLISSPASVVPPATLPTTNPRSLPSWKILVVDDAEAALYTLAELLSTMGQRVRTALDAAAAIEQVRTERPDVVISDIAMPNVDGYELAQRLRQEPGLEKVVLVALTGYGQDSDKRHAIEAGFDYHLVKPATMETLVNLLRSLPAPQQPLTVTPPFP
jgi:PAS domain S-box-containing protein